MGNVHFADRLAQAIASKATALMVGLDPRVESLPRQLLEEINVHDVQQVAGAFGRYCRDVIDVVGPLVPAIKPQMAFFEQLGPAGMGVLADVIDYAKQANLVVIMDGKRNDIGTTAAAYAKAYLGEKPQSGWGCDALTVNPYMGDDCLEPMIHRACETGSGVFALVKTSNPGGQRFQDLKTDSGPLYRVVGDWVQQLALSSCGQSGYGVVGAVVGATHPDHLAELRERMPNTFFLVPGFGAQGGTASDVAAAFDQRGTGAIVNSSRQIIFAYSSNRYASSIDWQSAVEAAARDAIAQLQL